MHVGLSEHLFDNHFYFQIFEGLGPRTSSLDASRLPQRTASTVFVSRKEEQSSYTHLWNLSGKNDSPVIVPDSFVKPNQSPPPATLRGSIERLQSVEVKEDHEILYCDPPPEDPAPIPTSGLSLYLSCLFFHKKTVTSQKLTLSSCAKIRKSFFS